VRPDHRFHAAAPATSARARVVLPRAGGESCRGRVGGHGRGTAARPGPRSPAAMDRATGSSAKAVMTGQVERPEGVPEIEAAQMVLPAVDDWQVSGVGSRPAPRSGSGSRSGVAGQAGGPRDTSAAPTAVETEQPP
jgi:hypothetical protein